MALDFAKKNLKLTQQEPSPLPPTSSSSNANDKSTYTTGAKQFPEPTVMPVDEDNFSSHFIDKPSPSAKVNLNQFEDSNDAFSKKSNFTKLITDANLYIDYGRADSAKEILDKACNICPDNIENWISILELASKLADKKAFATAVAKVPVGLLNPNNERLWNKVHELRKQLPVSTEITSGDVTIVTENEQNKESTSDEVSASDEESASDENSNVSSDNFSADSNKLTDDRHSKAVEAMLGDANFKLKTDHVPSDDNYELDRQEDGVSDNDNDELSNATKLDLARAYFEIGNIGGAKTLLKELIETGTESEKVSAQEMLDKLSSE